MIDSNPLRWMRIGRLKAAGCQALFYILCLVCFLAFPMLATAQQSSQEQSQAAQALGFVMSGDKAEKKFGIKFVNCVSRITQVNAMRLGLLPDQATGGKPKMPPWDYAFDWNRVIWKSANVVTKEFRGQCDPVKSADVLSESFDSRRRIECNQLKRKGRWQEVQFNCRGVCRWRYGQKDRGTSEISIEISASIGRVSEALADIRAMCPGVQTKY